MDRSRRPGTGGNRPATAPPTSSRLTVRKHKNRRRAGSLWTRLPSRQVVADACGRALRRSAPALAAAAALAMVGTGAWAGHRWLTRSPRFAITEIAIRGAQRVDADALRDRLPIHLGDNVFAGLDPIARAVRGEPWIASAEVRRVLPHTISIEVREHTAAAVVDLGLGARYLVDTEGRPFKRAEANEADGLPVVTGIERAAYAGHPDAAAATARAAIAAVADWRAAERPVVGEIHVDPHGAVTLHTPEQVAIQLGALGPELSGRIRTFDAAWASLTAGERARARAVHLDARPDHVTVAFAKD